MTLSSSEYPPAMSLDAAAAEAVNAAAKQLDAVAADLRALAAEPPPPPPKPELFVQAGPDQAALAGEPVTFQGLAAGGTPPLAWTWRFGDGRQVSGTAGGPVIPTHTYAQAGTYANTLTVTDAAGKQKTAECRALIAAKPAPPALVADAGSDLAGVVGSPLRLVGRTSGGSPPLSARWDFGDMDTAAGTLTPAHIFGAPGTYSVVLTVTDSTGAAATDSAVVTVVPKPEPPPDPAKPEAPPRAVTVAGEAVPVAGWDFTAWPQGEGNWLNPTSWASGKVPTWNDKVYIPPGRTVVVNKPGATASTVVVAGNLVFEELLGSSLRVQTLTVLPGGYLELGTTGMPAEAKIELIFADAPLDPADAGQYGNGLLCFGKMRACGAVVSEAPRLAREPGPGMALLEFAGPVAGWQVGDHLVLPDTRQLREGERWASYRSQCELVNVAAVAADAKSVTLSAAPKYAHEGARDPDGKLEFLPHALNLSRNVVIRSESATGVRGHCLFADRADVDIRNALFGGLGRTTVDAISAKNVAGRYPVHFHHLDGPEQTPLSGYQFVLSGCSVFCPMDNTTFKWPIVLHDSSYGLIGDNVAYNWAGAGIVCESGSEIGNVIRDNVVCGIRGWANPRDNDGRDGSGFWSRGWNNRWLDNVACACVGFNQGILAGSGFNLFWPAASAADTSIPTGPGKAERRLIDMSLTPVLEFARNEAYGACAAGLTVWNLGTDGYASKPIGPTVLKDFRCWHCWEEGYFGYPVQNLTFDGFVVRGHPRCLDANNGARGWRANDYWQGNVTIRRADIQNVWAGLDNSTNTPDLLKIEDSHFRVAAAAITVQTLSTPGTKAYKPPRRTEIRNCKFDPLAAGKPLKTVDMYYTTTPGTCDLTQKDEVYVFAYQGKAGDDFRIYYRQQDPTFVVPKMDPDAGIVGAPEAGLTNAQCWQKYGVAIAGAVAPAGATTRPEVGGLVGPSN